MGADPGIDSQKSPLVELPSSRKVGRLCSMGWDRAVPTVTGWGWPWDAHLPDVHAYIRPQGRRSGWFLCHLPSPGVFLGPSTCSMNTQHLGDVSGLAKQALGRLVNKSRSSVLSLLKRLSPQRFEKPQV